MKRAITITLLIPITLVLFLIVFLSIKYSPVYVYRMITMHVADVYDYKNFENRIIQGSKSPFIFKEKGEEAYVESLFSERVSNSGFNSFTEWAENSQTTALIFIRRDTIIYEKYFNGFSRESYFHSQSMAKSFVSFLIGAAIDEGLIKSVDDPMTIYIPELLGRDPGFEKITIRNLLEMRSGLKYNMDFLPLINIHAPWNDEVIGYYHPNVRKILLEKLEIESPAGEAFEYNNYNTSYLGLIIERATGKTVSEYIEERLWSQIMEYDALFSIDSKESGFEYMPSRLIARAIDYARFGRLYLEKGHWNGQQIISEDWTIRSTQEDKSISRDNYPDWLGRGCKHNYYSYQWWGNTDCDSTFRFFANGNLGQNIYVIPDKGIIMVHCGNSLQHYNDGDLLRIAEKLK